MQRSCPLRGATCTNTSQPPTAIRVASTLKLAAFARKYLAAVTQSWSGKGKTYSGERR